MSETSSPRVSSIDEDRLAAAGDDVYAMLVAAHDGLSDAESAALNARLVLVLANAVGDPATISAAIALAGRRQR
ncbi:MAG: DUF2783 domain-containing protein [Pseudomonadota bacterium]